MTKAYIFFSYWKVDFSLDCHTEIFNGHKKGCSKNYPLARKGVGVGGTQAIGPGGDSTTFTLKCYYPELMIKAYDLCKLLNWALEIKYFLWGKLHNGSE